ncbi:hypothetical protein CERSUDRAFT_124213 [Gelatoporia subvermispora B]|uniref:DUF6534 domain-containing protein n=1 Tax=Ceriporiopsis subvermispora (strain B) TaxID=914234 RepID=M2RCY0_CERS8|nr:hypothetical protein CERSUDRAFT_124213 [Gelatoporia subvermispora B]
MADIFISVSQIYSLWRQRSDFQATNNVVRLFMLYSLNTGVIVTLCAVESLATFAIMPNNEIYQAVYILLSPLLLNALLATYNLKWTVRGEFLNNGLQRPVSKDPLPFFNLKSKTHRRDTDCDEVLEVRIETARETSADWTAGP